LFTQIERDGTGQVVVFIHNTYCPRDSLFYGSHANRHYVKAMEKLLEIRDDGSIRMNHEYFGYSRGVMPSDKKHKDEADKTIY
jgi:hypothetical protein